MFVCSKTSFFLFLSGASLGIVYIFSLENKDSCRKNRLGNICLFVWFNSSYLLLLPLNSCRYPKSPLYKNISCIYTINIWFRRFMVCFPFPQRTLFPSSTSKWIRTSLVMTIPSLPVSPLTTVPVLVSNKMPGSAIRSHSVSTPVIVSCPNYTQMKDQV